MQVMEYAGIPISVTYEIVKNIAKKRVEKVLKYKEQFIKGMTKRLIKDEQRDKEEAEKISHVTWQIIEDSSRYSFNSSHSYSVAGDSLYGAYLKSHYPLEFYEVILNMLEKDGDKDRLNRAKEEATRAFGITFPPYKFGQDNTKIAAMPESNQITSSLASMKGMPSALSIKLFEASKVEHKDFVDFMIYAEENGINSKKFEDLILINYYSIFGHNKRLILFYKEFTSGKLRYSKTHSEKTKAKRIEELRLLWESIPDERLPIWEQLTAENEILGYIQAVYPEINRRYVYVMNVDTKFAPRCELYCLNNGKRSSIKVQKKIYDNNLFYGGEILYVDNFREKPAVKFVDGKYVESPDDKQWWMERYTILTPEQFDATLKNLEK